MLLGSLDIGVILKFVRIIKDQKSLDVEHLKEHKRILSDIEKRLSSQLKRNKAVTRDMKRYLMEMSFDWGEFRPSRKTAYP